MNNWWSILILIAMVAVLYFLMIRPQKKRDKEVNDMRNSIQIGDEIVTIGGLVGKIVKIKEDSFIVQCGTDRMKIEVMKWGISKVLKEAPRKAGEEEPEEKKSKPKRLDASTETAEEEKKDAE